jgi:hypothetical protein
MPKENEDREIERPAKKLGQIAASCLKLGTIGFGGIKKYPHLPACPIKWEK